MREKKGPSSVSVVDDLISMSEVAAILRVSKAQSYRLAAKNVFPTVRWEGSVRVSRAKLTTWIAQHSLDGHIRPDALVVGRGGNSRNAA
jgi:excisionase family DNA binding protein